MGKSYDSDDCGDGKKYRNNSEKDDDINSIEGPAARRIGTLDSGTTAFMQWLDSVNKQYQLVNL
ncbi:MAG: hypothetical protein WA941_02985 [Nitrososphaeraceae archaeon]